MYKQFLMAALCVAGLAAAGCSNSGRVEGRRRQQRQRTGAHQRRLLQPQQPAVLHCRRQGLLQGRRPAGEDRELRPGRLVLQALVANSTDVAVGFYDHTIQMQAKGKDVVAFVLLAQLRPGDGRPRGCHLRSGARRPSRARRSGSPHRPVRLLRPSLPRPARYSGRQHLVDRGRLAPQQWPRWSRARSTCWSTMIPPPP